MIRTSSRPRRLRALLVAAALSVSMFGTTLPAAAAPSENARAQAPTVSEAPFAPSGWVWTRSTDGAFAPDGWVWTRSTDGAFAPDGWVWTRSTDGGFSTHGWVWTS
jgi:hypothetical protein